MTEGDLRLYEPGRHVDVDVVADGDGNVATRGEIVGLAGEANGRTQVELLAAAGEGIGHLVNEPREYDETETYDPGEVVGKATVLAIGPVDWFDESDAEDLSVDDVVVADAGGTVRAYDDDPGDDTPEMQFGRVFATGTRATAETAEKVAVLRYK